MSLVERQQGFAPEHRRTLLELAGSAIEKGLGGERLTVCATDYPEPLRAPRATFVTLHVGGELRGCIGTLEVRRTLVEDVAHNARAAAFEDPRFPPLAPAEFGRLDIHISVLSAPEPVAFASEEDLLRQLRPRVDGLILQAGLRRGTFLPSVWEQLPEPREFLRHLKRKAGLPADYWAADIRVSRYVTASIP
ncbi:MAG: AmmeMemoRadiSam system protein A [Gammaproteobacteria bacterium]|nr:MAG: AmmeMemoRadiSam system protein A [Gammaproteobacteria bacterium]